MGVLTAVGQRFHTLTTTTTEPALAMEVVPAGDQTATQIADSKEKRDVDADTIHKGEGEGTHQDVEAGVAKVEAAQAVWGKYGRWIIIAG